ncbi:hypothetical protein SFC57_10670 [Niallia circulans]|uniref:hypothetical protein n=1 Tax=Niallia circulans TaxID=1397 RepID=UPI00397AF371
MKKATIKVTSGVLSGFLLVSAITVPAQSAYASSAVNVQESDEILFTNEQIQSMEEFFMNYNEDEFYNILEIAVNEAKSDFIVPSAANEILNRTPNNESVIQPFGKVSMTAKAGAKALKALMKKVGKSGWNKMIKKIESMTGTELVIFHWKSMNQFVNFLSDSGTTIENAITNFLVKKGGFNKTVAKYISKAFVLVVF